MGYYWENLLEDIQSHWKVKNIHWIWDSLLENYNCHLFWFNKEMSVNFLITLLHIKNIKTHIFNKTKKKLNFIFGTLWNESRYFLYVNFYSATLLSCWEGLGAQRTEKRIKVFSIFIKALRLHLYIYIDVTFSRQNGRTNWETFLWESLSTPRVTKARQNLVLNKFFRIARPLFKCF